MDYRKQHLESSISDAQSAIQGYLERITIYNDIIAEFSITDPTVAQIYMDWNIRWNEAIDNLQVNLIKFQSQYNREYGNE